MKAISDHQPWATLVALGIKTIETRSWSTRYRGPLAIHAAKTGFHLHGHEGNPAVCHGQALAAACQHPGRNQWTLGVNNTHPFPLGAIVATCELVDCLPIIVGTVKRPTSAYLLRAVGGLGRVCMGVFDSDGRGRGTDLTDQIPYGDFAPGRYAWLLANIKALPEPVLARGHQGLWEWAA